MSGAVLLNLLSIFSIKSKPKKAIRSSKIQISPNLYSLFPIIAWLQIFPFSIVIPTETALWKSGISFLIQYGVLALPVLPNRTPFQVMLPNPRGLANKSSFIPRTSQLWNSLPSTAFPESYNLSSFKSNINKLDLISFSI